MIYFIRSGAEGPIKVGTCHEGALAARLSALQIGNPNPCEIIATMDGDRDIERQIHVVFRQHNQRGEWFDPDPEVLDFIKRNGKAYTRPERYRSPVVDDHTWRVRLAAAVEESSMSMREASIAAGLSDGYVHGILKDGKEPTITKLMALAAVLNIRVSFLIGEGA